MSFINHRETLELGAPQYLQAWCGADAGSSELGMEEQKPKASGTPGCKT